MRIPKILCSVHPLQEVVCQRGVTLETETSSHLRQRSFGLGQPEGHVHGAVEGDGSGQGG